MNMQKYQKSRSQLMVESTVRFNDFVEETMEKFQYDNLLIPKNLLLLLAVNEVNGYRKNGEFSHFTRNDNFIQFYTAICMGDTETIYIEPTCNGSLYPLTSVVDEIQKGSMTLCNYDNILYYGHICTVSIVKTIKYDRQSHDGSTITVTYRTELCSVSRMTNYHNHESYYSDDDLVKFYRAFSGNQIEEIPHEIIDELQKELSAMCDFITR